MTPEQVTAIVKCLADLYQQLELERAEHQATKMKLEELQKELVAQ